MPKLVSIDRPALARRGWTLAFLALAGTTFAQALPSESIRDAAGLFGADAIAKARKQLAEYEKQSGVPVVIETVETLEGKSIDDTATKKARQAMGKGVYILAAQREHKIEVLVSEAFEGRIPEARRLAIRGAFIEGFRQGNFDAGLERGVEAIGTALGKSSAAPAAPETRQAPAERESRQVPAMPAPAERHVGDGGTLVLRDQVRLTLAGARRILAGAEAKAAAMGLKMNIAVVDDGGHMLAFERMDGARPASGYTATTKAVTAATFRAPSGPVPAGTNAPDPLLNLSLQNAAMASGGKLTTLYGGVPVVVEGQVIGGVGVGGGSGEQDATVARAGIDALLAELKSDRADH